MHEHEMKSIGLGAAQRAVNAGGVLMPIATPFYSGGYRYTHVLHTVRGKAYRVSATVVSYIQKRPERTALQCAARTCPGCSVCSMPPNAGNEGREASHSITELG